MLKFNFKYGKCPPFSLLRSEIVSLSFYSVRSDVLRAIEDNVFGLSEGGTCRKPKISTMFRATFAKPVLYAV